MVLRRFISLNGCPAKIFSDLGSQLTSASKELKEIILKLEKNKMQDFATDKRIKWSFGPGNAPWYNGCSEALIKSVKKAIGISIGEQVLSYSELQTVFFEVANLVNEQPIGRHPTNPLDGS